MTKEVVAINVKFREPDLNSPIIEAELIEEQRTISLDKVKEICRLLGFDSNDVCEIRANPAAFHLKVFRRDDQGNNFIVPGTTDIAIDYIRLAITK
jgi:hypothetical protein